MTRHLEVFPFSILDDEQLLDMFRSESSLSELPKTPSILEFEQIEQKVGELQGHSSTTQSPGLHPTLSTLSMSSLFSKAEYITLHMHIPTMDKKVATIQTSGPNNPPILTLSAIMPEIVSMFEQ